MVGVFVRAFGHRFATHLAKMVAVYVVTQRRHLLAPVAYMVNWIGICAKMKLLVTYITVMIFVIIAAFCKL